MTDDRTEQTDDRPKYQLPANTSTLHHWLDEMPNFVTVEREKRVRTKDSQPGYGLQDKTVTESVWVHPDYELSTRACHGSQAEVCEAWEEMQFPAHNFDRVDRLTGAHLYTWSSTTAPRTRLGRVRRGNSDRTPTINYEAVQHPDGHGVIQHYDTIAAVRTKSGLVLVNEQDFATGFARMTRPDEWDDELPLDGIESVISGEPETLYDIESITRFKTDIRYQTTTDPIGGHATVTGVRRGGTDRQIQLVDFTTGAAVYLMFDSTANNPAERKCAFYVTPEERATITTEMDAETLLQPMDVIQARERGLEVIPADDYAGQGATYDGPQLGNAIIRQGEWYLVPMDEEFTPDVPTYKPLPVATRDSKWEFPTDTVDYCNVDDVLGEFPEGCPDCGATTWELEPRKPKARCTDCDTSFIFGEYEPKDFLNAELQRRYQEALDTLDSHRPRDLAVDEDGTLYVRGTFRHIDNEHQMIHLRDRWHIAAENTRDVTVFDLGTDTIGVGRVE